MFANLPNINISSWDALLLQLMIKKLDRNLYVRFIQSLPKPKEVPATSEFMACLEH